jgi:hypothetical protein
MMWILPPSNSSDAALSIFGSVPLVTGFAFVLYSRLHFVCSQTADSKRNLRCLLIAIIIITIFFSLPGLIVTLLGSSGSVLVSYKLYKIVVYFEIPFAVEDVVLQGLYIYYFWKYLKDIPTYAKQDVRQRMQKTFYLLLAASSVVLLCDIVSVTLLCMKMLLVRFTILGLLYAWKLNTEFFILNRLVDMTELKIEVLKQGNMSPSLAEVGTEFGFGPNDSTVMYGAHVGIDTNDYQSAMRSGNTGAASEVMASRARDLNPSHAQALAPTPGALLSLQEKSGKWDDIEGVSKNAVPEKAKVMSYRYLEEARVERAARERAALGQEKRWLDAL